MTSGDTVGVETPPVAQQENESNVPVAYLRQTSSGRGVKIAISRTMLADLPAKTSKSGEEFVTVVAPKWRVLEVLNGEQDDVTGLRCLTEKAPRDE